MSGPNTQALEEVLTHTRMEVIASGGVSCLDDLEWFVRAPHANLYGVIIGKALYEGAIRLSEAIEKTKESTQ